MPVTTADVPYPGRSTDVAESAPKKTTADKPAADKPALPAQLARASESGDPAVHQLLAERQTHLANGDTEKADAATAALADLGFA